MFRLIIYFVFIPSLLALINPEWLKPCFERYEESKLVDSLPFHSEWRMNDEGECLPFCAKATSRCRSVVYDKLARICHYFMVDGVDLKQVVASRNMVYLQLADMDCVLGALEKEEPDTETAGPDVNQISEQTGPGNVSILFAPENFPQPPSEDGTSTVASTAAAAELDQVEQRGSRYQKGKKQTKFDEKLDKQGLDEDVLYTDDGELVDYQTSKPEVEESMGDVRIANTDDSEDYKAPTTEVPDNEQKEYSEQAGQTPGSTDYDFESIPADTPTAAPTTIDPPPVEEEATTAAVVQEVTEDPRSAEVRQIKEEMERLEKEVAEMRDLDRRLQLQIKQQKVEEPVLLSPQEEPALFSLDSQINPKMKILKMPPSPIEIMEKMNLSVVPAITGFKASRKELPSSIEEDIKASVDVRRHPGSIPLNQKKQDEDTFKSLAAAYVDSLNAVEAPEDVDNACPPGSNVVWIAVENSDLPRIGQFVSRRAERTDQCIGICNSLNIDGRPCNSFVFYEKLQECSFGHEQDIFSVKAAKDNDFSTRAFKKLCYPETLSAFKNCDDFLGFRDYKLNIEPKETFDGLPAGRDGVSACVELCTLSNAFKCKSASFDFETGTCAIFDQHSLSAPEAFKEHRGDSLLYFENGCNVESITDPAPTAYLSVQKIERKDPEPVVLDFRTLKH